MMAIDNERYEVFLNNGWVIDTQGDDVPDVPSWTLVLKEGAPEHIIKEYQEWKDAFDSLHNVEYGDDYIIK